MLRPYFYVSRLGVPLDFAQDLLCGFAGDIDFRIEFTIARRRKLANGLSMLPQEEGWGKNAKTGTAGKVLGVPSNDASVS
jgi:hypothetical protein